MSFIFTFRYKDDVLSLIYLIELVIKDTAISASCLDLEIDNKDRLRAKLYDKRDDFNFPIVNIPRRAS